MRICSISKKKTILIRFSWIKNYLNLLNCELKVKITKMNIQVQFEYMKFDVCQIVTSWTILNLLKGQRF